MSGFGNDCARLRCDYMGPVGYMDEILIDILSRLPVKTVGACKTVAKHWLRLISEPGFPHLQLAWASKKLKYIICPYSDDYDVVTHLSLMEENGIISQEIPLSDFESICSPVFTCFLNGLICCVNEDCYGTNEVDIRILNPITHDTVLLPSGSPSIIAPSVGIAFDPKSNDFKAFRFFSDSPEGEDVKYKCEVYTSSSTAWRIISENVQRPDSNPSHPFVPYYASIAGSIYWFVWSQDQPGTPVCILSVDMNENFTEINLPTQLLHSSFLIELEGCLSVVHVNTSNICVLNEGEDPQPQPYLEVYKFENHGWKLRSTATVDLTDVHSFNSIAARDNEIFFIYKREDESCCYLIYDFVEITFKTLDLDGTFQNCSPVAFPFTESLFKCSPT